MNAITKDKYTLPIEQTEDPLYPCVVMRQEDDQVELIDEQDIPNLEYIEQF